MEPALTYQLISTESIEKNLQDKGPYTLKTLRDRGYQAKTISREGGKKIDAKGLVYEKIAQDLYYISDLSPIIIQKGQVLWRCAPNFEMQDYTCFSARQCSDTGKTGLYFGTYLYVALAICVELKKDLKLGKFIATEDMVVPYGKYAYRKLIPESLKGTSELDFSDKVKDLINVSHFDNTVYPLTDKIKSYERGDGQYGQVRVNISVDFGNGELFLSEKSGDLAKIKLVQRWQVNHEKVRKLLNGCGTMLDFFDVGVYEREGALFEIDK